MKILGLTGGSGTGKSTVARLLSAHGVGWIDADAVYHTLCASCAPMLRALQEEFGDVLHPDGALNRPALAKIVFSDAKKLERLNQITLPYIRDASREAFDRLAAQGCALALYDAPTLLQNGLESLCDAGVLAVLAPVEVRIKRIMSRDGLSEPAARARIEAQPPDTFYGDKCKYIIRNNEGLEQLRPQVERLWEGLQAI